MQGELLCAGCSRLQYSFAPPWCSLVATRNHSYTSNFNVIEDDTVLSSPKALHPWCALEKALSLNHQQLRFLLASLHRSTRPVNCSRSRQQVVRQPLFPHRLPGSCLISLIAQTCVPCWALLLAFSSSFSPSPSPLLWPTA